ncbi:MAG TPA: hypothetical protein PLZ15_13115 [Melioribacteraceae bacterium]|nr:hypothetical protein [Melioribacteraceae bacterium]
MKKILLLSLLLSVSLPAQELKFGTAKGLFMGIGVGPRIPLGNFSESQNIGIGFDATFSYTDNTLIPFFLYTTVGYQHYPGRQDFYKRTDYSSLSSNVLTLSPGIRYYFPPLIESVLLLMPVVDAGLKFAYFEKSHQFKLDRGKSNYVEEVGKFGFHIGAGFSMFLLDVITYYNYLNNNEYISFNLRVTIPIFVTF